MLIGVNTALELVAEAESRRVSHLVVRLVGAFVVNWIWLKVNVGDVCRVYREYSSSSRKVVFASAGSSRCWYVNWVIGGHKVIPRIASTRNPGRLIQSKRSSE